MELHELSYMFTKCGFGACFVVNSFFIFLTITSIKRIYSTYKIMVVIFALMGILFAGWETVARPFAHNYNKGFLYFSLSNSYQASREFLEFAIVVYGSFYLVILAFIVVQFIYRYLTLFKPVYLRKFKGKGMIVWMTYPLIAGAAFGGPLYCFGVVDEYSDEYLKKEIFEKYKVAIKDLPRFAIVTYDSEGYLRWRNISYLITSIFMMGSQYLIIIFCGIRMHLRMGKELKQFSVTNRNLQKQFFKALVFQTLAPTLLFVVPAAPILMGPLFDTEMSIRTGLIYVLLNIYPPIDSIAFMVIVSEYKQVIREIGKYITSTKPSRNSTTYQMTSIS
ncbi:Seven TM Receptor [Caenorhabditis elegans]|uniref:Seven TM Receptor n=1 Tax=Caenorhabditis elegans TaxID=6239 RepID=O18078_CAEEL|nr:Seven TM Receptor [Caenorhabditis elegans]CAB05810.2 Seven TM Receptor [Caenorhabditis elegans]|eukprot:NP_506742.2 Seven TM Receptor [Caenorhabditis elegans]